jgi:hypothetical protein
LPDTAVKSEEWRVESEEPCARHVKDRVDLGLKQQKKRVIHEDSRRHTKGHEENRKGKNKSTKDTK